MSIHIRMDLEELTLDDLEALEEAKFDPSIGVWTQVRKLLARFAFEGPEEDAAKLEYEDAVERMGGVSLGRIRELMAGVSEALEEVAQKAIPPTTDEQS